MWTNEVARWKNVLAVETDNPSSVPGTHIVEGTRTVKTVVSCHLTLTHGHTCKCMCPGTWTHKHTKNNLDFFHILSACTLIICMHGCLRATFIRKRLLASEEAVGSPGTGVTDSCEPLCGCWELNLCHLQEQPVLLKCGHLDKGTDIQRWWTQN